MSLHKYVQLCQQQWANSAQSTCAKLVQKEMQGLIKAKRVSCFSLLLFFRNMAIFLCLDVIRYSEEIKLKIISTAITAKHVHGLQLILELSMS